LILRPSVRRSDEAFTRYDRRTDQSDRPVGPTIGTCKRPLRSMSARTRYINVPTYLLTPVVL